MNDPYPDCREVDCHCPLPPIDWKARAEAAEQRFAEHTKSCNADKQVTLTLALEAAEQRVRALEAEAEDRAEVLTAVHAEKMDAEVQRKEWLETALRCREERNEARKQAEELNRLYAAAVHTSQPAFQVLRGQRDEAERERDEAQTELYQFMKMSGEALAKNAEAEVALVEARAQVEQLEADWYSPDDFDREHNLMLFERARADEARAQVADHKRLKSEWDKAACERACHIQELRAQVAALTADRDDWKARFAQWEPKDQIIADLTVQVAALEKAGHAVLYWYDVDSSEFNRDVAIGRLRVALSPPAAPAKERCGFVVSGGFTCVLDEGHPAQHFDGLYFRTAAPERGDK